MRAAWIEVSLSAIKENIRAFKSILSQDSEIMGIVKAEAYGHGAAEVAGALREEGIKRFGVALVQEGVELRERGFDEPILILGYTPEEDFPLALRYGLTLTLYNLSQARALDRYAAEAGKPAKAHIKVDTGMGRIGFQPEKTAVETIVQIAGLPNVALEGIFSHLAWADNQESDFTDLQFGRFQRFIADLAQAGVRFPFKHIANSAATINFPHMHLDLVRIGISLYGLYPDTQMAINPKIELHPAMQVKATLVHVKEVPPGTPLSYGCTFTTQRRSLIGTVPMGYADGVPRVLSNKGGVLIRGRRCPIVGRVCMDQFMVDLTDLRTAAVGDEVVFLGSQGKENITADEIAEKAGTISYEIVTRMSDRLPRRYY
ncbi:MAG: alanine racemase [Deltaproteobacteria bacterium]|nr:alanine racemase [Deltaproteobacteria bacterium]MBW1927956.1 alanine racemase [Deltaproteobacteria bacterium]